MKLVKTDLLNKIDNDFLYHCLITHVETDEFQSISTDDVVHTYQAMHDRKGLLP
jgi:hypothetical protein